MKIIVNPGHWNTISNGPDNGATGIVVNGTRVMERDRTGAISKQVAQMLPNLGVEVELYPFPDNSFLPDINEIGRHARAEQVALLIAVHCDASGRSGASAYFDATKPGSHEIGAVLSASIATSMGIPNLGSINQTQTGVCGGRADCTLAIHRESRAGAGLPGVLSILVECGFVDNANDAAILAAHPELAAQGIVNGIGQYYGLGLGTIIVPDPDYAVYANSTINLSLWREVLTNAHSPVVPEMDDCYNTSTDNGVNPAVALAFLNLESNYGTAPGAEVRQNWGNLSENGQLKFYDTWTQGLVEWCNHFRIPPYSTQNLNTISQIVPVYRPASTGGTVAGYNAYIQRLHDLIKGWHDTVIARGQTFFPQ